MIRSMQRSRVGLVWGAAALLTVVAAAQADNRERGSGYIGQTLRELKVATPRMAWAIPPNRILATTRQSTLFVFSDSKQVRKAEYLRPLSGEKLENFRRDHPSACENVAYEYRIPVIELKKPTPVFYSSRRLPDSITGYEKLALPEETLAELRGRDTFAAGGGEHRYFAISSPDRKWIYSLHAFYDSSEPGKLRRLGVVLHDHLGVVRASHMENVSDSCGACRNRTAKEGPEAVFGILNLVTSSRFRYPVLVLDRSTERESAISLLTFDPNEGYSEYRIADSTCE